MATVLDPILNSPRFPHYLRQLEEAFKGSKSSERKKGLLMVIYQ